MRNRKRMVSILAGVMAAIMLLTLVLGLIPTRASAVSSSEIKKQIAALKEDREAVKEKIKDVQAQYEENEDEIADIIAKKNVIDQEIQLLYTEIDNINARVRQEGGVPIDTLVAGIEREGRRSFKILRAKPDGKSYARDIADKYGLTYDNIIKTISKNKGE